MVSSQDVMLSRAAHGHAPSRALCEAILPTANSVLPRSSRAVAGAVGEGRRGGRQRGERRGERRGELCASREER